MTALLKKEFTALFCSPTAGFFLTAFLLAAGLMHWFVPGSYNIIENGYADLHKFFTLAPVLFLIFIPALSMRSFSDEIKTKNLDVFRTRPVSITRLFLSKLLILWFTVNLALTTSLIYVYSVWQLAYPVGNIDLHEITASYLSLSVLSLVFITVGLFSSSLSKNQFIAFITAIFLNFILFYGFEMIVGLTGNYTGFLSSLGLLSQTQLISRGLVQFSTAVVILSYIVLFSVLSIFILSLKTKRTKKAFVIILSGLIVIDIVCFFIPDFRFDFTRDKRYTLSDYSKHKLDELSIENQNTEITVYLDGDLNAGFSRLRESVYNILSDFKKYSNNSVRFRFINPYSLGNRVEDVYLAMERLGMNGIVLNETDREGKISQKVIYPYAHITDGTDTLQINLLKNISGYTAEENLNTSVENLEFEFMDAIRIFRKKEPEAIAFIEGHAELPRLNVYDAEEILSKYYFINRGQIGNDVSVLDDFKAVIIAGSTDSFTENEKFVIDQYIMAGGRVLWLIDGVYLSHDDVQESAESPSIKNETNLDDLLFSYGVRINPVLLQDTQCTSVVVATGEDGAGTYSEIPWYYSLLLLPSQDHVITKDIPLVKAVYASSLDVVDKSAETEKNILLTTSLYTHTVEVPEMINFNIQQIQSDPNYFNRSFLPVAISLSGSFTSAYVNRFVPDSVNMQGRQPSIKSRPTKMVVASSSDIIRNDAVTDGFQTQVLPMGFDRVSERIYGNREFIINAVKWLTGDDNQMELRSKRQQIRLLDKQKAFTERNLYAAINIVVPLVFVWLIVGSFYIYRKRKYEK